MHWRVILAAFIIAALLAGGLVSLHHTAKLCTQVSSPLEQLSAQLQQKAPADLALLQQAMEIWQRGLPYLSSVLAHDRLDAISGALFRAEGFLKAGDSGEALAEVRDALWQLSLLGQYDKPTVRSLL
mgnify:FL=1